MWKWLERKRPAPVKSEPEFRGAPATVRRKTYSAVTGYVYQYVYRGYKELPAERPGRAFVFSATRNRSTYFDIIVELLDREIQAAATWALSNAERYALAKMTLFAAFDEHGNDALIEAPLAPDRVAMREHLNTLGRL